MKKIISALLVLVMLVTLFGCNSKRKGKASSSEATPTTPSSTTTTTVPSQTVTKPITTLDPSEQDKQDREQADNIANNFIKAFVNGDTANITKYYKLSEDKVFDFLKNVKFASSNINFVKNDGKTYIYDVKLNITEDKSNTLKTGEQTFTLKVNLMPDVYFPPLEFYYKDTKPNIETEDYIKYQNEIVLCFTYEYIYDYFKGHSMSDADNFYLSCLSLYCHNTGTDSFSSNNLNTFIKDTFKISNFDSTKSVYYNKNDNIFEGWQTEGPRYIFDVASVKQIANNKVELTVDYYADYSCLIKVKSVKYVVLTENSSKNRILSRDVISDTNIKVLIKNI